MPFASLQRTRLVRPLVTLFAAAFLASSLSACVTSSRGGDALSWGAPAASSRIASLEDLVDGGSGPQTRQIAQVAPQEWKAVLVSGSYSILAYNNAAMDFGQRLRDRGVERVATALTGGVGGFNASRAGIRQAMASLGGGQGACLFFATSHGNIAGIRLEAEGGNRVLTPRELDRLLEEHCGDRPTVAILSDCDAGIFLDSRMRRPNRILIAAAARGRDSYGARMSDRYVNFDRCLMGAIDSGATTWRDAFQRTLPCVQEREAWLRVRPSEPQAYFGGQVANLALPGAPSLSARLQ
ncbi:MAG: hypothetical protein KF889_23945 [Alphaproteobacteria bacterium]|nr:hypothetical protein [Alphaproteobacteria bacterium]MCW5742510.1 hypothetical protein [Alphaproteobacteria bacterium]